MSATIVNRRNAQTQSLPPARSPAASQALGKRWQLLASACIHDSWRWCARMQRERGTVHTCSAWHMCMGHMHVLADALSSLWVGVKTKTKWSRMEATQTGPARGVRTSERLTAGLHAQLVYTHSKDAHVPMYCFAAGSPMPAPMVSLTSLYKSCHRSYSIDPRIVSGSFWPFFICTYCKDTYALNDKSRGQVCKRLLGCHYNWG